MCARQINYELNNLQWNFFLVCKSGCVTTGKRQNAHEYTHRRHFSFIFMSRAMKHSPLTSIHIWIEFLFSVRLFYVVAVCLCLCVCAIKTKIVFRLFFPTANIILSNKTLCWMAKKWNVRADTHNISAQPKTMAPLQSASRNRLLIYKSNSIARKLWRMIYREKMNESQEGSRRTTRDSCPKIKM